jgi:predicted nucleic acid-binding protein
MATNSKVYLESCCFIDLAKRQLGIPTTDPIREKHVWFAEQFLRAARAGDLAVYTSMLTITECLHVDKQYSTDVQRIFRALLSGASGIVPIQPDIFIVERARDLRWVYDIVLKPMDSLHVASAVEVGCAEFITTDDRILKKIDPAQISAAHLGLQAVLASDSGVLPDGYRQAVMKLVPSATS